MFMIPIPPGEEVVKTIGAALNSAGVENGAVVSLIGMVLDCTISTMEPDDPTNDIPSTHTQALELSGNGEIRNGVVHLHVVLGATDGQAISGHLISATTGNATTNAYVLPLDRITPL
ncbi:DNA-binding protein [Kribbella speibonae]|uniref:DNA-binding protein n=2 Tax=Kribbella speibonae TaxID=1572660 RepID=A0A4R0IDY5_9ACTN|nr:DNA-binding protein [Kribbella speibonae]